MTGGKLRQIKNVINENKAKQFLKIKIPLNMLIKTLMHALTNSVASFR